MESLDNKKEQKGFCKFNFEFAKAFNLFKSCYLPSGAVVAAKFQVSHDIFYESSLLL